MRRRQIGIVLLAIALVLGGAACSNRESPSAETEPAQTPAAETAGVDSTPAEPETSSEPETPPVDAASTAPETPEASESPLPGADEAAPNEPLPATTAGPTVEETPTDDLRSVFDGAGSALANLDSYRYVTTFVYAGVEDGEVEEGSIELRGAVAPSRQHLEWIDLSTGEGFELIRIENQAWMLDKGSWQEVPTMVAEAMSSAILVLAPAFSWEGLYSGLPSSSARVGSESVNGIPATHYTSTYQGWGDQFDTELVHTQGDVWIADEGYPVKYAFTASGVDEDGEPGTLTWTMELLDVHGDIVIEPPEVTAEDN